jgi:hypothetical protein
MGLFEGKTTTERNKIIAAGVLGVVALVALYLAFGSSLFGSKPATVTTKSSPTPRPNVATSTTGDRALPSADDQRFQYETTQVDYRPGSVPAPDPGRNIFAFYEPPPPCKPGECPTRTPTPTPQPPTPVPPPTPPILLRAAIPQNVYAGSAGFKLQLDGVPFPPNSRIFFNQTELPTTFLNDQRIAADIPANLIAQEGPRQIIVQTPDGKLYSNAVSLMVNPPPKPTVQYIGMIARKMRNNDTAYLMAPGGTTPIGARLNDVVAGQFRLIDISSTAVIFEDVNLGFKHRVPITPAPTGTSSGSGNPSFPFGPGTIPPGSIPGIPGNIQRYVPPPAANRPQPSKKDDVDDNDKPRER